MTDYNALAKQFGAVSSTPAPQTKTTKGNVDYSALAKQFGATDSQSAQSVPTAPTSSQSSGGIGGFLKGLVSAPATILARPIQAVAELAGASPDQVDSVTNKLTGGIVAPVPRDFGDVGKDVGRGIQTVALGASGPISAGATLGLGSSLEQGNNLLSAQTAFQTVLGAAGGKVLDLVGKPLIDAAGKVIGKITPQTLQDVASKGTKAIQDFASAHEIVPAEYKSAINELPKKAEAIAERPFELVKKPFVKTPTSIVNAREKELAAIDSNYSSMRKASSYSSDAGAASRKRIASTDVLSDAVDENGLIRTKQPGGAVDQYRAQTLDHAEGVVRKNLDRLGEKVSLDDVEKQLTKSVNNSGLEGADLKTALNGIKKEIAGYRLKVDSDGKLPLTLVHDAKISTTNGINYQTPPEVKAYRKAIARGLKTTIEDNSSFNTKEVNTELSKYLDDINFLERLDGKKVKGGKLGKYFAQISGNMIGGLAGSAVGGPAGSAVGSVVGGELGSRIKGSLLKRTLSGETGMVAPKSQILLDAIEKSKLPKVK